MPEQMHLILLKRVSVLLHQEHCLLSSYYLQSYIIKSHKK